MRKLIFILLLCLTTSASAQFFAPNQKPMLGLQVNKGHPLGDPVAFYLFNEGSGNKVFDLSGNGNHGTLTGLPIPSWMAGDFGSCLRFPGNDQYVNYGINAYDLGIRNKATFIVWVKVDSLTPINDNSFISDWQDSVGFNLILDNEAAGQITFYIYPDNTRVKAPGALHLGWNCVAGVLDGTNAIIYNDGIYKNQAAIISDLGDSAATLKIGARGDIIADLFGYVDSACIYNRDLSAAEIALLYREPFCMVGPSWNWCLYNAITVTTGGQVIFINMN